MAGRSFSLRLSTDVFEPDDELAQPEQLPLPQLLRDRTNRNARFNNIAPQARTMRIVRKFCIIEDRIQEIHAIKTPDSRAERLMKIGRKWI